jgi:hypothetical protein
VLQQQALHCANVHGYRKCSHLCAVSLHMCFCMTAVFGAFTISTCKSARVNFTVCLSFCPLVWYQESLNGFWFSNSGWHLPILGETAQQWWTVWRSICISVLILSISHQILTIGQNAANKSCTGNWYILCQTHFFQSLMASEELKITWTCYYYYAACVLQN